MSLLHDTSKELGLEFKTYNELVNYSHAVPVGMDTYFVLNNGVCIAKLNHISDLEKYLSDAYDAHCVYKKILKTNN